MTAIANEIRALIASGPYAHLTTLNQDGSPQVSVVWVGIENDEFVGFITRITPHRFAGVGPWTPSQK